MLDSTRTCINSGGSLSVIRLPVVPQLDAELILNEVDCGPLQVWRARPGEIFTVTDPEGSNYRARVVACETDRAVLIPFATCSHNESFLHLEVYQAIPERERFELILQKLTELGVARIVPFTSQRSISQQERDAGQKKSHRWPDVLLRAARQCRRTTVPELGATLDWSACLQQAAQAELTLLLYEGQDRWAFHETVKKFRGQRVALIVGPEGGFTTGEVEQARQLGVLPVGLGPRLLRTETAAITGAALVQYQLGDLGEG